MGGGYCRPGPGLGARVIVCEINPVRALEAVMEGYELKTLVEAAPLGDIFVTATGCNRVIGENTLP